MVKISFTGHRPDKIGGYNNEKPQLSLFVENWLAEVTERIIDRFNNVEFISGAAQGVDTIAAEVILKHKETYIDKNIQLTMAVPYKNFGERWPQPARDRLQKILNIADKTVYVREAYTGPIVLQIRNEWMVNNSDIVIAVWDGSSGGTMNCAKYAEECKRKIWRLNPLTCESIKY
jgi:uncharacterized phage-like protein YoqJ